MKRHHTDKCSGQLNLRGLNEWMNTKLPTVVEQLKVNIQSSFDIQAEDGLNLTGRTEIYELLDNILAVLFPGYFTNERVGKEELDFFLTDMLRHISHKLGKHIREVFRYRCRKDKCDNCACELRGQEALTQLVESLPSIRSVLLEDISAAYEGDPAARYLDEILLSYPCVEAIATYRIAHQLYKLEVPIIPRILSERAHSRTGIDIHPGAQIQSRFFIDHGTGVVIGETCRIGRNVKVYQGVTLGALSPFDKQGNPLKGQKRHPDIEDDVIIYANATILGGKTTIGKGAIIGGNTWITSSVPPGAHVYNRRGNDAVGVSLQDASSST